MGKVKPVKVSTPGSYPNKSSPGRPKTKPGTIPGWSRKGNYRTKYSPEALVKAIKAVENKRMAIRESAKHYGVPFTTLRDRIAQKSSSDVGRPTELSKEEEQTIVERVILMGWWGFPLNRCEISHLIKSYLNGLGRVTRFVNNLPGPDFMKGFMKRHPSLTERTANMIKRGRAALSHEEVNEFFDRIEEVLDGVPPENVWNYDETNLTDNPGAQTPSSKEGSSMQSRSGITPRVLFQ
jgi:transposase-like protein